MIYARHGNDAEMLIRSEPAGDGTSRIRHVTCAFTYNGDRSIEIGGLLFNENEARALRDHLTAWLETGSLVLPRAGSGPGEEKTCSSD